MDGEVRGEVRIGNTVVPYKLSESKRAQQLSLRVEGGAILAVGPVESGLNKEALEAAILKKKRWVIESLEKQKQDKYTLTSTLQRHRTGAKVVHLGHERLLKVERSDAEYVILETHVLRVGLLHDVAPNDFEKAVSKSVELWQREETLRVCSELAAQMAKCLELPVPKVSVFQSAKMWGLCELDGTLKFDWRIVQLEMRKIEEIIAHEVAHLKHRNHGEEFGRLAESMLRELSSLKG
jgi:predicted metal-dependent hydrolase